MRLGKSKIKSRKTKIPAHPEGGDWGLGPTTRLRTEMAAIRDGAR